MVSAGKKDSYLLCFLLGAFVIGNNRGHAQGSVEQFLQNQPVIDMHFHITKGYKTNEQYNSRSKHIDSAKLEWVIENLDKNNIVLVAGGGNIRYASMYANADKRIWAGLIFPCRSSVEQDEPCQKEFLSEKELRQVYRTANLKSMGESLYNYYGIPPTDERLAPYWKVAAELSLPVGVHSDSGPSLEKTKEENPNYNPEYANPLLLKPILEKYPQLRIYLMHYGSEYSEEAIQLMKAYPQIYCEMSAVCMFLPKQVWEPNLKKLYEEGLGNRLMFASDYFGTIEKNLEIIFDIGWLTDAQKRDIYYNNAARFLGLSQGEVDRHHEQAKYLTRAKKY